MALRRPLAIEGDCTSIPYFTLQHIETKVGSQNFYKGEDYFHLGMVEEISCKGILMKAKCKGTQSIPYSEEIFFNRKGIYSAHCTCRVGNKGKCKHIAAVLLHYKLSSSGKSLTQKEGTIKSTKAHSSKIASAKRFEAFGFCSPLITDKPLTTSPSKVDHFSSMYNSSMSVTETAEERDKIIDLCQSSCPTEDDNSTSLDIVEQSKGEHKIYKRTSMSFDNVQKPRKLSHLEKKLKRSLILNRWWILIYRSQQKKIKELNLKLSKEERNIQQHEMTSSKLQIKSQKLLEVEKELEQLRVFCSAIHAKISSLALRLKNFQEESSSEELRQQQQCICPTNLIENNKEDGLNEASLNKRMNIRSTFSHVPDIPISNDYQMKLSEKKDISMKASVENELYGGIEYQSREYKDQHDLENLSVSGSLKNPRQFLDLANARTYPTTDKVAKEYVVSERSKFSGDNDDLIKQLGNRSKAQSSLEKLSNSQLMESPNPWQPSLPSDYDDLPSTMISNRRHHDNNNNNDNPSPQYAIAHQVEKDRIEDISKSEHFHTSKKNYHHIMDKDIRQKMKRTRK